MICRFQPFIFQGVPSPTKQKIQVSRSSCAASKMCAVTCRPGSSWPWPRGSGFWRFPVPTRRFGPRGRQRLVHHVFNTFNQCFVHLAELESTRSFHEMFSPLVPLLCVQNHQQLWVIWYVMLQLSSLDFGQHFWIQQCVYSI